MKLSLALILAALVTTVSSRSARAAELRDLYRGARETAMGGASTAITEGDEAIYLNPAAMAGNTRTVFYLLNLDGGISTDTIDELTTASSTFKNINVGTINKLMGKNLYSQGTLTSAITVPNFGFSLLIDEQAALLVQNQAMPQVLLGAQTTSGIQFATGFSVLPKSRRSKSDLRVGVGFKIMFRRGGYHNLTLDQIYNISQQEVKNITGNFGEGMSGDLGLQYSRQLSGKAQLLGGLSYTEMGNMKFSNGGDAQPENLSVGLGSKLSLGRGLAMTLGYDIKHLTQDVQWAKRNHFGADFRVGNMDFMGGLNEGRYLSGGIAADFWLIRLTALSYAEEIGEYSGQMGERRYMLRLTLKFDTM